MTDPTPVTTPAPPESHRSVRPPTGRRTSLRKKLTHFLLQDLPSTKYAGVVAVNLSMLGSIPLIVRGAQLASKRLITSIASYMLSPESKLTEYLLHFNTAWMGVIGLLFLLSALLARNSILPLAGGRKPTYSIQIAVARALFSLLLLLGSLPALFLHSSLLAQSIFFLSAMLTLFGTAISLVALLEEVKTQKIQHLDYEVVAGAIHTISNVLRVCRRTLYSIPETGEALAKFLKNRTMKDEHAQTSESWKQTFAQTVGDTWDSILGFLRGRGERLQARNLHPFKFFILGQNPITPLGKTQAEALFESFSP
ncbi:hypothetical protein [Candidatus Similichlamydia laticola]|uniref:Transmembrane protein n=1 Tax=Candidatus Similichlamydia laticola TaxID=2170265 RepID=A0A369KC97_9BACT|nr:hypothetical protein [Candidatus Similichlamydia laticola]RDB31222.1 hypothetical protein HAT2_00702 [Candidatus Similichlamydia laticola]